MYRYIFLLAVLFISALSVSAQGENVFLAKVLANTGQKNLTMLCDRQWDVADRVFIEYGSMFVTSATPPARCIYKDEAEVTDFQRSTEFSTANLNGIPITLQKKAMAALLDAIADAKDVGLTIRPRGKSIAGTRSYADTSRLWLSRFDPALKYWQEKGRISKEEADATRSLTPFRQVPIVLAWESKGMYFSTGFSRTILSSVAAPGTSQHLSGLAFDAMEFSNARVRAVLNRHGWFQTVAADEPHFTYIGVQESELPGLGLKTVMRGGYKYWVPEL